MRFRYEDLDLYVPEDERPNSGAIVLYLGAALVVVGLGIGLLVLWLGVAG